MEEKNSGKKLIPPYLPYKTFINFLDGFRIAVPNRIDRSLMRSMAGTLQRQLISALEYLNLITPDTGVPKEQLQRLVHSEGPIRQKVLKETLTTAYPFLFNDSESLQGATSSELQEKFSKNGTTGIPPENVWLFFLKAAKDAGIAISPHIKKTPGPRLGSTRQKRKLVVGGESTLPNANQNQPPNSQSDEITWDKLLLSKFPSFDPAWPDDVKVKWFEAFEN